MYSPNTISLSFLSSKSGSFQSCQYQTLLNFFYIIPLVTRLIMHPAIVALLAGLAAGAPAPVPQGINFDMVNNAPSPSVTGPPASAVTQDNVYNTASAAAAATTAVTAAVTTITSSSAVVKRGYGSSSSTSTPCTTSQSTTSQTTTSSTTTSPPTTSQTSTSTTSTSACSTSIEPGVSRTSPRVP